jgi:hypothetical protein
MRPIVGLLFVGLCALLPAACSGDSTRADRQPTQTSATAASADVPPPGDPASQLIGTWDYEYDAAEARTILQDFSDLVKDADRVVARLAFVDEDEWWLGFLFDGKLFLLDGEPEGDAGTYTIGGSQLALTGAHDEALTTYRWSLTGPKLSLTALEACTVADGNKIDCTQDKSGMDQLMLLVTEHTFVRSGDDVTYGQPAPTPASLDTPS